MKKISFVLLVILLANIVIIYLGKIHFEEKIISNNNLIAIEESDIQEEGELNEKQPNDLDLETAAKKEQLTLLSRNLPVPLQEKIQLAMSTGKPLQFIIMGSESSSSIPENWSFIFESELKRTYGEEIFDVQVVDIFNKTSSAVINEGLYKPVLDLKPDVFLFEPFILKNNGKANIDATLNDLIKILNEVKRINPDVNIFIQPSYPLYNAVYYPREVNALKEFSNENGYVYLDHWQNWPDYNSEELRQYLNEENYPNDKGHKVWAEYLVKHFVAE